MLSFVAGILVGGTAVWIVIDKIFGDEMDNVKMNINKAEEIIYQYKVERTTLRSAISRLADENNMLKAKLMMGGNRSVDPVMKEAAKKAMMASHPDITRKHTEDDFIKFKRLYDSLK